MLKRLSEKCPIGLWVRLEQDHLRGAAIFDRVARLETNL